VAFSSRKRHLLPISASLREFRKCSKAPSFKDPAVVKASDSELIADVTRGKNKMPAYQAKLTAPEIKAAVAYVRTLQK
jgi:hypothetical protein